MGGGSSQLRLMARCDCGTARPSAPIGLRCRAAEVNAVAYFLLDGAYVYSVFANGRGYRWDVRPAAWARHACAVAGRRLTRAEWGTVLPERPFAPAC